MADIGSYLVIGVVLVGGFWLLKNGPGLLMQLQAGGGLGGGGGGLGGGVGGTGDGSGFTAGGGGDLCAQNPNDPTCQLSGSSVQLGPGTTKASQITRDIVSQYGNECVKGFGCPKLSSSVIKGLPLTFPSAYNTLGQLARNSQEYIDLINQVLVAVATKVIGAQCAPCAQALGSTPSQIQAGAGCIPRTMLTDSFYNGQCARVCAAGTPGYASCFLGHACGKQAAFCNPGQVACTDLENAWHAQYDNCAASSPQKIDQNCTFYPSSRNYCWLSHCTSGGQGEDPKGTQVCDPGGCSTARSRFLAFCQQKYGVGGSSGGGGTVSHGSGSAGHTTFSCASNTGSCFATADGRMCMHICDVPKQKNCVWCVNLTGATGCAAARAQGHC
jgi:hypothetical protein